MIIPVENNRSYRITCFPPDEDGSSAAIKEQQVLADLSSSKPSVSSAPAEAAPVAAVATVEAPAVATAEAVVATEQPQQPQLTRKEKKDLKKRRQAARLPR